MDLEDEESRALWEQLSAFKENAAATELPFPATLSSQQRKQVHYFAERLGLTHFSQVRAALFFRLPPFGSIPVCRARARAASSWS